MAAGRPRPVAKAAPCPAASGRTRLVARPHLEVASLSPVDIFCWDSAMRVAFGHLVPLKQVGPFESLPLSLEWGLFIAPPSLFHPALGTVPVLGSRLGLCRSVQTVNPSDTGSATLCKRCSTNVCRRYMSHHVSGIWGPRDIVMSPSPRPGPRWAEGSTHKGRQGRAARWRQNAPSNVTRINHK